MIRADFDRLDELYQMISGLASLMEECWNRARITEREMADDEVFLAAASGGILDPMGRIVSNAEAVKELLLGMKRILPALCREYRELEQQHIQRIQNLGEVFEGMAENAHAALTNVGQIPMSGAIPAHERKTGNPEKLLFGKTSERKEDLSAVTRILEENYCYREVESNECD